MSLKNIAKKIVLSGVLFMATINGAFAANEGLCKLIDSLKGVFQTLRVLAFVGAAFVLAGWAWQFITSGYGKEKETDLVAAKQKGIGMIIGFSLLLGLGTLLSFLPTISDCKLTGW